MLSISFEWDPRKDRVNQAKHGVSFADAKRPFSIRGASWLRT